jgi:hypothetical protein
MKLSELMAEVESDGAGQYIHLCSGFDHSGDAFLLVQNPVDGNVTLYLSDPAASGGYAAQTFTEPLFLGMLSSALGEGIRNMRTIRTEPREAA